MKNKKEVSGLGICSIVFGGLGICFLLAGIISFCLIKDDNVKIVSYIFSGVGAVFTVITIMLLSIKNKKKRIQQSLIDEGQYVMADIIRIFMNTSITYGSQHPYKIYCQYVDEYGKAHKFCSGNIMLNPDGIIEDTQVRVYVNRNNYKRYYVDTDSIMPEESLCIDEGKPLNKNKSFIIMGTIFTLLSIFPFALGILLFTKFYDVMIIVITSVMGIPLLSIGLVFLIIEIHKRKMVKRCKANDKYVMAEVVSICRDPSVQLSGIAGTAMVIDALKNGSNRQALSTEGYYLQCVYKSGDGVKHIFRTGTFFRAPGEDVIGREVKVYYYGSDMKKYFMDTSQILD